MKTVVSLQELVDVEIRPDRLFDEFRDLSRASVAALAAGPLVDAACQACGSAESRAAFEKLGLKYRECEVCHSVFVSPRPSAAHLAEYYRSSPAARFWRDRVLRETLETRRAKLAAPRAEWVADGVAEHRPRARRGLDLSPHGDLVAGELAALLPDLRVEAVPLGDALPQGDGFDLAMAFDTLDRAADVRGLVDGLARALQPGGLLFVIAPTISGFDLQVLWERSPSILPPDKLNLLSIDGFSRLFAAPPWKIIELSTPGMFDVENVRHAIDQAPGADWPRPIRSLVDGGDAARAELQEYLQRHRLASFARLIVRRT
jgi:SAM-dependent methyltransferase